MKTIVAAIGALALTATIAQAAPARLAADPLASQAVEHGYHVAGSQNWRDGGSTRDRTPNQGAGTSRSKDANQG